jgi:flagellar basal-body rod modification protein FlgD
MTPTVSSVASTSPAATSSSTTTASATTGFGNNFNTFLTLLTTQLKAQDPTSPLDTNQFTQQLVQFAQVEQAIDANTKLSSLVSMQTSDQAIGALPLVGKTVQFSGNSTVLPDGGSAQFSYSLPSTASQAVITITNAQGQVVWRGAGSTDAGSHDFTWDGKNAAGVAQPPGTYTMDISAQAADKSAIKATVSAYGKVDGVQIQNNAAVLAIGGMQVPVTNLLSIGSTTN